MINTITIWENTYECDEQYICTNLLYLLSILSHAYNFLIDLGVGWPRPGKYVLDGLNDNHLFSKCWSTNVKLHGISTNNSEMVMHTVMIHH